MLIFSYSRVLTWNDPTLRVLNSFTGSVLSMQLEKLNKFVQAATRLLLLFIVISMSNSEAYKLGKK